MPLAVQAVVRRPWVWVTVLVSVPIAIWTVRLLEGNWIPQGDEAIIAVKTHDVFSTNFPLLGMRTTSPIDAPGVFVYHPGPLQFYLLAPIYMLSGFAPWGLLLSALSLSIAIIGIGLWGAWLIERWVTMIPVAVTMLVLIIAFEWRFSVVWNPFPATLAIITMIVLGWAVAVGESRCLPWFAFAMSLVAQLQLATTPVAVSATVVLLCYMGIQWRLGRTLATRRSWRRTGLVLIVCWLGPIIDLLINNPHNVQEAWRYLTFEGEPIVSSAPSASVPTEWVVVCAVAAAAVILAQLARKFWPKLNAVVDLFTPPLVLGIACSAISLWTTSGVSSESRTYYGLYTLGSHFLLVAILAWSVFIGLLVIGRAIARIKVHTGVALGVCAAVFAAVGIGIVLDKEPVRELYSSANYFTEQDLTKPVVETVAQAIEEISPADLPIEVQGWGWNSVFHAAPAVFADQVMRGRDAHFDLPWPFPDDDDFRRVHGIWGDRLVVQVQARDTPDHDFGLDVPESPQWHRQFKNPEGGGVIDVYIYHWERPY